MANFIKKYDTFENLGIKVSIFMFLFLITVQHIRIILFYLFSHMIDYNLIDVFF